MAVLDQIATARDDVFASRVAMSLMLACITVANESGLTANHTNRMVLVNRHIKALVNTKAVAAVIIANSTAMQTAIDGTPLARGSNITDADLNAACVSLFNTLANAHAAA